MNNAPGAGGQAAAAYANIAWGRPGGELFRVDALQLHRNRCLVLRGANGSGKTTLLKILGFLLRPAAMEVRVAGRALSWSRARARLRRRLVYLHQDPYLFDDRVERNLEYGLRRAGVGAPEMRRRVAQALEWSALGHLAQRNARQLSGGERQRVALARARVLAPEIMLLDEPTTHMDREARTRTHQLVKELREEGAGIVIVSHDALDNAFPVDGYLLLQGGSLRQSASDPLPPGGRGWQR